MTDWRVSAWKIHSVQSAYYDDRSIFPPGSVELDHALLMRDIPCEWHSEPEMTMQKPTVSPSLEAATASTVTQIQRLRVGRGEDPPRAGGLGIV